MNRYRRSSLVAALAGVVVAAPEIDFAALEQRVITFDLEKNGKILLQKQKKPSPKVVRTNMLKELHSLFEQGKISRVEEAQGDYMPLVDLRNYIDRLTLQRK